MPKRGERIIATWDINLEGAVYPVTVKMIDAGSGYDEIRGKVHFQAIYADAHLDIRNVNIDELRKATEEYLRQWAAIDWRLDLYIETSASEGNVEFSYKWIAIGDRKDGKQVYTNVDRPHGCGPFCREDHEHMKGVDDEKGTWDGTWEGKHWAHSYLHEGLPPVGFENDRYGGSRDKKMRALVPATPETFKACWRFEHALQTLGREIQKRFAPDDVVKTLQDIARSLPQLPEPKEVS